MGAFLDAFGGICVYCEREVADLRVPEHWRRRGEFLTPLLPSAVRDHVDPRSRGGSNRLDNLVLACSDCNSAKSDTPVEEWLLAWIGEAR